MRTNRLLTNGRIPRGFEDAKQWDITVGKARLQRVGACGTLCPLKDKKAGKPEHIPTEDELIALGAAPEDISLWKEIDKYHESGVCILPVGHSGECSFKMKARHLHPHDDVKGIIASAYTSPGDSYYFKNRCRRSYPYLLPPEGQTMIIEENGKEQDGKFMSSDWAATPSMSVTAALDMLSFLIGIEPLLLSIRDNGIRAMLNVNLEFLKKEHPAAFDESGKVVTPLLGKLISSDQFYRRRGAKDKLEFGHISPVREDQWMTRGGNVWIVPRDENSFIGQLDIETPEGKDAIKDVAQRISRRFA